MTNGPSERKPADEVIRDLKSTSDKIRHLATAGYLRTEISKILGIRYQHVRKVLVDAGFTDGLRRTTRAASSPTITGPTSSTRQETPPEFLLQAGFRFLGKWMQSNHGAIMLDTPAPAEPGVYALALDNVVVYVGLASRGLQHRMNDYRRGNKRQRTSARINKLIKESLGKGGQVEVLFATPEDSKWNGLPVDTAAGLEAGLICTLQPKWNIQGGQSTKLI